MHQISRIVRQHNRERSYIFFWSINALIIIAMGLAACRADYLSIELANDIHVSYPADWKTRTLEDGSTLFQPSDDFYQNTTLLVLIEPAIGETLFDQLQNPLQTYFDAPLASLDDLEPAVLIGDDMYQYETEIIARGMGEEIAFDTIVYLRVVGDNIVLARSILETSNDKIRRQHRDILRSIFSP